MLPMLWYTTQFYNARLLRNISGRFSFRNVNSSKPRAATKVMSSEASASLPSKHITGSCADVKQIIAALKAYRKINSVAKGNKLRISQQFVVPLDSSQWPSSLWGMKLGTIVRGIVYRGSFSEGRKEFLELGLVIKPKPIEKVAVKNAIKAEDIIRAIETYRQLNNVLEGENPLILSKFVVPSNSPQWPEALWGMKLGYLVNNIRNKHTHAGYRDRFEKLGLFAGKDNRKPDKLLLAVETYRKVLSIEEGCRLSIPVSFVVPNDSPEWPSFLWGFKLGISAFNAIYNGEFPKHEEKFNQLGLTRQFEGTRADKVARIVLAVKVYRRIHRIKDGDRVVIPKDFEVPRDNPKWSRELWGMKLGTIAYNIVYKNYYREHNETFHVLGLMQQRDVQQYLRIEMVSADSPRLVKKCRAKKSPSSDA